MKRILSHNKSIFSMLALLLFLFAGPVFAERSADAPADAEPVDQARVIQLIDNLNSPHDAVRAAAQKDLDEIGFDALGLLRQRADDATKPKRAAAARQQLERLDDHDFKILDAFGQPIAGAKVTIRANDQKTTTELTTNLLGNLRYTQPEYKRGSYPDLWVRVEHPKYGAVMIERKMHTQHPSTFNVPLIPEDHQAADRAVRGVVVDPDNKPAAGVEVICRSVRTPGEGVIAGNQSNFYRVLTGEDGAFRLYLVATDQKQRGEARGERIPPGSNYDLLVHPAEDSGLWRWAGRVENSEPATIKLARPTQTHRLLVELAPESYIDRPQNNRDVFRLFHESDLTQHKLRLSDARLFNPTKLMPGTYRLEYNGINYLPIVVNADSPKTLAFRLPTPTTITGKVVDGITGKPIEGALVFGYRGTRSNATLALVTDEEWDALHKMPATSTASHGALARIQQAYIISQATRTDAEGRFEITQPIKDGFSDLIVVDQDKLPVNTYGMKQLEPDEQHRVSIDTVALFPAAKAVVFPQFNEGRLSLNYRWQYANEDQPDWFKAMRESVASNTRAFHCGFWLELNKKQPLLVPAGVSFRLICATPYAPEWSDFVYPETLRLEPGQTLELKRAVNFEPSTRRTIRVVDQAGKPVEGVPVRMQYAGTNGWDLPHNTNAQGLSYIYVDPLKNGLFAINVKPIATARFEDADDPVDKVYEIRLTEEQINQALGIRPDAR